MQDITLILNSRIDQLVSIHTLEFYVLKQKYDYNLALKMRSAVILVNSLSGHPQVNLYKNKLKNDMNDNDYKGILQGGQNASAFAWPP